jgi:hypothetical protein
LCAIERLLPDSISCSGMSVNERSEPELIEWLQIVWEGLAEEDQGTRERKLEQAKIFLEKHRELRDTVRPA